MIKFLQQYECVNASHKHLEKIYAGMPKPQGSGNPVTKFFSKFSDPFRPGTQD